jgi:hypothetical protein
VGTLPITIFVGLSTSPVPESVISVDQGTFEDGPAAKAGPSA